MPERLMPDKQTAHTPGPWHTVETRHAPTYMGKTIIVADGDNGWVALTHIAGMQYVAEANARLIAAAPDLLAACEAYLAFEDTHDGNFSVEHYMAQMDAMTKAARGAVARAKKG